MRKFPIIMALSLLLVLGLAMQASALSITYSGPGNYAITSPPGNAIVDEDYNALSLVETTGIGFESHDGFAVIDKAQTGEYLFFDKVVVLDDPNDLKTNFELTFNVLNTTPYTWSDYHLFILAQAPEITFAQSAEFKTADIAADAFSVAFSAVGTGSKEIAPGDTLHLNIAMDTSGLTEGYSFNLRQIATAVPLPPSALLLGSGILGLLGLGWRRKVRS